MALEFRVLGPLEVRRDGVCVQIRGARIRTLLAVLLVDAGRVASADALIDALWPNDPPADARHALEMSVSRLRALLGGRSCVPARPPGYALDVDEPAIDSVRFRRLLAEARDLVEVDAHRAAARVDDALALWRGDPYADFAFEPFAREEIAQLEELRAQAEELRIDAALATGPAEGLLGEISTLVAAEPTRERRREQLMLALYRAGRQADALATFREASTFLRDELGLEPGTGLRGLERAILRQDESLSTGATQGRGGPSTRRPASAVVVEPDIPLELDAEEHERRAERAASVVGRIGDHFGARRVGRFELVFLGEDHGATAAEAAAELAEAVPARTGIASGDVLVRGAAVGGPLLELAHRNVGGGGSPRAPAPERRADGPFLGRSAELEALRSSTAALVLGPPGIGKSRLLRELAREVRVVAGRCSAYGQEALTPLREIASALGHPEAVSTAPVSDLPVLFRRLCEAAAPVTIALDDAHWASPTVIETMEYLVHRAGRHLRVVCLAREDLLEERPTAFAEARKLVLEPLTSDEAHRLAAALGAHDDSLVERAEGNPLFIEQLLAHAGETSETLPSTLRSLLVSRLDRLTPSERSTVACAAVAGREFDAGLLGELLESSTPRAALHSLVRRGLLDPAAPAAAFQERYRFRHPLIHEAAYGSVPTDELGRLHEAVADGLDGRRAGDELVGFHLECAALLRPQHDRHGRRLAEEAGERLGAAGVEAWKLGDASHAVELLGRAVVLLPTAHAARGELLCELGIAQNTLGLAAEADETLTMAAAGAERRVVLRARLERAALATVSGGLSADEALAAADEAVPVFEAVDDARSLGRALMLAGWIRGGAFAQHAQWLEAAERALVQYGRAGWRASTCIGHIAAALYLGPVDVATAIDRSHRLLEDAVDDLAAEAAVTTYLGGLYGMAADFGAAHELAGRGRALYEMLGRAPALRTTCAPVEAGLARLEGDVAQAAERLEASCSELVESGDTFHVATQAAELVDDLIELGRTDAAKSWCAVAEHHCRPRDAEATVLVLRARARLAGDPELALEAAERADETDALNLRAAVRVSLAATLAQLGRDADATAALEHARELYLRKGNAAAAARLVDGGPRRRRA
jgi:DNA-binding SARP family transcriptional activator/tetratricopeptide (TPR) repeat protein